MKNITISRIEPTNPALLTYVSKIKSWDKNGIMKLDNNDCIEPFYALYYGPMFCAASTIEFDKESSLAKVAMINGSNLHCCEFQAEAISKIENLVTEQFGAKNIEFNYVKRMG